MLKQEGGVERIPFVDLAVQYESIQTEIDAAMQQVLEQSDFILGRAVQEFEQAFAGHCLA